MKAIDIVHIGICVSDIDASIDFYTRVMGFKIKTGPTIPMCDDNDSKGMGFNECITRTCILTCNDNFKLELTEFINPESMDVVSNLNQIGKHHIAYRVDDIFAFLKKWEDEGLYAYSEPILVEGDECMGSFYWSYVKDPDGITLELNQPIDI